MADPSSRRGGSLSAQQSGHRSLGIFCIIVGAGALWIAQDYEFGTVITMGPGFVPRLISAALILMGIVIIADGGRDVRDEAPLPPFHVRSFLRIVLCVIGSIVLFGLALVPLGLAIATFLMVALAMLAQRGVRAWTLLLTAFVLAVFAVALFPGLLGIAVPVLPQGVR